MHIPPPYPNSGSFNEALKRMTRLMQQHQIDDRIFEMLKQAFEKELGNANVTLSRPERIRLLQQVSKTILDDVLEKIDNAK